MDGHSLYQNKGFDQRFFTTTSPPAEQKSSKVLFRNGLRLSKLIEKNEPSHALASSELHRPTSLLYQLRAYGKWRALF
jgi:hypothetical protein